MSKKIHVMIQLWNSAMWLPYAIRGIYKFASTIGICESCWVPEPEWVGETSKDGTADLIRKFISEEDPDNKVKFIQGGLCKNQPEARNVGLSLIPDDTDWVFILDGDEFYFEKDLELLRRAIEHPKFEQYDGISVDAKCFYFDSTYYKVESFSRGYRWFKGQRFWAIASMFSSKKTFNTGKLGFEMIHFSYVNPGWTKTKGAMGEDLSVDKYKKWWNEVYSKFDGDLEKLYQINSGGVHPNGGGPVERYHGPYPECLEGAPILKYRWGQDGI